MAISDKAKRATISLGELEVDGFQMPDGSYRMSQAQATQAIEEPPVYALRFLGAKGAKALLGDGYTDYKPESVEVDSTEQSRGQTRINALPLEVVSAYWLYRALPIPATSPLPCSKQEKPYGLTWDGGATCWSNSPPGPNLVN